MLRNKPSYVLFGLAFIASSQLVLGKFALERMPVFGYMALRFMIAYLAIYILLLATRRKLPWKKVITFAPVALLWILSAIAFIFGLQRTDATTTQFIHTSIPITTAILAGIILRHRLTKVQWLGVVIAFVGVAMIILSDGSLSLKNANFVGSVLVFSSAIGFAFHTVLTRLPKYGEIDPFEMVFIGFTFGVPIVLPFAVNEFLHKGNWLPSVSLSAWVALILASVALVFFATIFQKLINKLGPSYASLNMYLTPLFVIVWAAILLHETPKLIAVMGCGLALIGVGLVSWHQRKDDAEAALRATSAAD